jgi:hypothetical protein
VSDGLAYLESGGTLGEAGSVDDFGISQVWKETKVSKLTKGGRMNEENFREVVLNGALENFLQSGYVSPILLAVRPDDTMMFLSCGPLMEDKDKLAEVIEDARMHLPLVAFVTESWMVKGKDLSVQPKDHPDREEVVMAVFYQGMKSKVVLAKIHRPVGCSPHLGEWEDQEELELGGRLCRPPAQWN